MFEMLVVVSAMIILGAFFGRRTIERCWVRQDAERHTRAMQALMEFGGMIVDAHKRAAERAGVPMDVESVMRSMQSVENGIMRTARRE